MAAPDHIPTAKADRPRTYSSPPWRPDEWVAQRPAELGGRQPMGPRLGYQGPDQGYALKLARQFDDRLVLTPGEHADDVIAGAFEIALKRASLFGRAPVIHDLTVALTIWGYLGAADAELVALRRKYFRAIANPHHYMERRRVADVVPVRILRMTTDELTTLVAADPKREKVFQRRKAS